ncbi:Cap15 family cyclic dinucleotide receptor domain-containing protein [Rubrivivax gelatinosus]|uniref:Cap15 family cyclic dinucleotide receptor domain-containing protein n=1 Tax=Rubrivivax gelatinosus TaxID=28068 RepID=UPI00104D8F11|nr:hypothetical protein [Rubrivivax gelatinosus]MBK1690503.1 hypothetical protein [Rubrivivax gelatinosus]
MEHEYSVLGGLNRAAIGRYLSIAASAIAAGLGSLALWLIDLAKKLGLGDHVPGLVMWPLTAGLIYMALYWLFESRIWKWSKLANLLKVPDLSGTWDCKGQTLSEGGSPWAGEVTIVQSWDKLRVRLKTGQSRSSSVAAALVYDQADGFRLLYNYKNEPRIGEANLKGHRGSAELTFSSDLQSAEGEYFNGHGRYTFGTLKLIRRGKNGT